MIVFSPKQIQELALRIVKRDSSVWNDIPANLHDTLMKISEEMVLDGSSELAENLWNRGRTESPVSIYEFINSDEYLGFRDGFWKTWSTELEYVLDPLNEVYEWIIEGGIRAGKTTASVVALLYKIYVLTTFHDPQELYGLLPETKIGIALFNIVKKDAQDGSFYQMQTYMQRSPYFRRITKQRRNSDCVDLPKRIVFAVGSMAIHTLGRALFAGLLDEANIPRTAGHSIYSQYTEMRERMDTQFKNRIGPAPLLCLASQPKAQDAFLSIHREKYGNDPHTYVTAFSTWDAREHQYRDSKRFYVVVGNEHHQSTMHEELPDNVPSGLRILTPPMELWESFYRNLGEAIRDLGGIPTFGVNPFISQRDLIDAAACDEILHPFEKEEVMTGHLDLGNALIDSFRRELMFRVVDKSRDTWRVIKYPGSPRFIHVDLAKGRNDAAGMSCVCLGDMTNVDREDDDGHIYSTQDYLIHVDFTVRVVNREYQEIGFQHFVDFISWLYAAGLPILHISYDRYGSAHSIQDLDRRGFSAKEQSVDRTMIPYEVLRQVILERRIVYYRHCRMIEELKKLVVVPHRQGMKVDHPIGGGKDTADALCGAVYCLLNDKRSIPKFDPSLIRAFDDDTEETRNRPEYHIVRSRKEYEDSLLNSGLEEDRTRRKSMFSRMKRDE